MQDYGDKADGYFAAARRDIEPLLPACTPMVLEVGCGKGATLRWLRETGRCKHAVGMELFDSAAKQAARYADRMIVGNAEALIDTSFGAESFDLILCLDVLEHMVDPWSFVAKAERLLQPGGSLVASVPNVRHLAVLAPLLLRGRWRYTHDGILDRTHLRFFTRESALALLTTPRLQVTAWRRKLSPLPSKSGWMNLATLGLAKDLLASQYLVAARLHSIS
jgi:2-polyprenyl-3-methyl-5-hydroxy-6-metoxy-1,4-benzoquinol methylase